MKRIAIITGASAGLGAEFAIQYAEQAVKQDSCDELWLIARRHAALKEIKNTIKAVIGAEIMKIRIMAFDISGYEGAAYFEKMLTEEQSKNDVRLVMLINNAGFGVYGAFRESVSKKQLEMIELNCTALTGFCAAALPFMQKGSCIINIASMAAFAPVGNFAVYAATKAYVLNFSIALRNELQKDGINVITLCPGQINTEFAKRAINNPHAIMRHAQNPKKIVAHCLSSTQKNTGIVIWGLMWKLQAFFSRFIGRNFFAWFTFHYIKRIEVA